MLFIKDPNPQNPIARDAVAIATGSLLKGACVIAMIAAIQIAL
jgi:hypothetical protein